MNVFNRVMLNSKIDYVREPVCLLFSQVGHVQKVSLVPGKVHEMRTLSLKPLLFGKKKYVKYFFIVSSSDKCKRHAVTAEPQHRRMSTYQCPKINVGYMKIGQ